MRRIFVGHRGAGKSSLLKRHQQYFPNIPHFDLDKEIEKYTLSSITDFFKMFPEEKFRAAELDIFKKIVHGREDYVIAVGAGFPISKILALSEVVFVSRVSDADGRIFLNRPRLDQKLAPLLEFEERYQQRDPVYRSQASWIYHMPEGIENSNEVEEDILRLDYTIGDAYYTLKVEDISRLDQRVRNYLKMELRTDLLSEKDIQHCIQRYPEYRWLVSVRHGKAGPYPDFVEVDCDIRFCHNQTAQIISTHTDDIELALTEVQDFQATHHIKLCPLVESFEDLKKGFRWQQENPQRRSFLPRSMAKGRWNWFRLLCKYTQRINFVRGFTDQADQPTVYQWLTLPKVRPSKWAAVVGSPIHLSRSPIRHEAYFKKQNSFMLAIPMYAGDFKENFDWLCELGLNYLAVTSPLKEIAYQLSTHSSDRVHELKSTNTLKIIDGEVFGHNTDMGGFTRMIAKLNLANLRNVAVWGGGGTLHMLKKALPKAKFFSSQTGLDREAHIHPEVEFETVVWAAPRSVQTLLPPLIWPVRLIVDLNYAENSMGLEYAQKMISNGHQVQYVSGLDMFNEQARQQQAFWSAP